ncbi:MAG: UDP-glucose/GDP-mannose dehydrogenase family protein [Chloroflexi bacterium]|nr:UDP-glucose/GDP-mannose dehydrogenase family protein [Chloroflexota bacterium]
MLTGVIGYGVLGSATAQVLSRLGHKVAVRDTNPSRMQAAFSEGHQNLDDAGRVVALFICVPEGNLFDAVSDLPSSPLTVIRSTVTPGTTERLSEAFGRTFIYMPEFLREATSLWDALNPSFILIGCKNDEEGQAVARLFSPLLAPIILVPRSTAEMVKLTLNAYLHTLVSFWNEMHMICEEAGIASHVVGKICAQDPRVSPYGATMHGKPVGGRCLPKDLAQLIAFAEEVGHTPGLLYALQEANRQVEKAKIARNGVGAAIMVAPSGGS